jgi:four helix bundle protein
MRRAATSIPSNVAEGYGRGSTAQYKQGVSVARGSCAELETQLMIAKRLHFAPSESFARSEQLTEELSKILNSLVNALGRKSRSGHTH